MAIRMATINPARYFGLKKLGVVAPGRYADLVVFSELNRPVAEMVFRGGQLVARDGQMLVERGARASGALLRTVHVAPGPLDFTIPAGDSARVHVIGVIPDQVTTRHLVADARMGDGVLLADTERDILKIGVVERHQASGRIGKGFIQGFGLTRGAIAGTVAHDHHNLVVIGVDDESMRQAVEAVVAMDGGLVVVADGQVLARLPLPVAGLMSDAPIETIREGYDALIDAAHSLGCRLADPMMTMSFMGLEVIPALKVTDLGVVDVEAFELVDVRV
jgi:adenine deaminase